MKLPIFATLPLLVSSVRIAAQTPAKPHKVNPGLVAGDVIYSLNNQHIASLDGLRAALKARKSGDPIALQVERSGPLIYITAILNNARR